MSFKSGCLKPVSLGCLGLFVFFALFTAVSAFVAWRSLDDVQVEEEELTPQVAFDVGESGNAVGRVVIDFAQGEFEIGRSAPGEGIRVEARYDKSAHELVDEYIRAPDGTWIYTLSYRRTIPGLQSALRAIMGGASNTYVRIYLPPDVPLELKAHVKEGGFQADLGGLWLKTADITFSKGGFELGFSEPTREPMEQLSIRGRMGGFEADELGNASPAVLIVNCGMGGAEIDLRGAWLQDCDADLSVRMGGMVVMVPEGVNVQGLADGGGELRTATPEVPVPRLTIRQKASMGEIKVIRR